MIVKSTQQADQIGSNGRIMRSARSFPCGFRTRVGKVESKKGEAIQKFFVWQNLRL